MKNIFSLSIDSKERLVLNPIILAAHSKKNIISILNVPDVPKKSGSQEDMEESKFAVQNVTQNLLGKVNE